MPAVKPDVSVHAMRSAVNVCKKFISITGSYTPKETKAIVNAVSGKKSFVCCFKCRKPGHKMRPRVAESPEWSKKGYPSIL
jgi:hypothetical protein